MEFENDVKEYGIQTMVAVGMIAGLFENDVKEYGIQTIQIVITHYNLFENDVKEQTLYKEPVLTWDIFRYI